MYKKNNFDLKKNPATHKHDKSKQNDKINFEEFKLHRQ